MGNNIRINNYNGGTINMFGDDNPNNQQSRPAPINFRLESHNDVKDLKAFLFDNKMTQTDFLRTATKVTMALWPFFKKHNGDLEKLISWLNNMP